MKCQAARIKRMPDGSGRCLDCDHEYEFGESFQECVSVNVIKLGRPNYGPYEEVARISQLLFMAYSSGPSYPHLSNSQKETLRMNAVKTARIVCGDVTYIDNWVDIVGYTNLIVNQLKEKSRDSTS